MAEEHTKLKPRQRLAIQALLAEPSIVAAAKTAGCGEATLRRWLRKDENFQEEFRLVRCSVMQAATAKLQGLCGQAVEVLQKNMTCGTASIEVKAACAVLDHATKLLELDDLRERIESLEGVAYETQVTGFGRG